MLALRTHDRSTPGDASAAAVVTFWRNAEAHWFAKDPAFDAQFRGRFETLYEEVVRRGRDDWLATPDGALALVLMTDQYPRNAFRGTARMYEVDALARFFAHRALERGNLECVEPPLQLFLALPFAHSEGLTDQDLSVALHAKLGQPWLAHAEGHRDIIRRFRRFPHRNAILGRASTQAEQRFLDNGGFTG